MSDRIWPLPTLFVIGLASVLGGALGDVRPLVWTGLVAWVGLLLFAVVTGP